MTSPSTPTSPLSYALVTPSFRLDLERCQLLVESVARWVPPSVRHYLVVDRRDAALFRPLLDQRTELLIVEDIVPGWLVRIPGFRKFWLSFRTRPLKNWILQQIVKMSLPYAVEADVLLNTDSDVFFIAPFDPHCLERDGQVSLFVESGQRGLIKLNDEWHAVAARLLGLPVASSYDTNFIGNVVPWRRANVLALHHQVQQATGKPWQLALAPLRTFSEYVLYGLYSSEILADASGHCADSTERTLCYWGTSPLSLQQLRELAAKRLPSHHSAMISGKSRTPVADIRAVFVH